MTNLSDLATRLNKSKIAVFGDIMLDDFTYGKVERISPEAPVPIVEAQFTEYKLGGCGNVAAGISDLGGEVYLFSVVGDDLYSGIISGLLKSHSVIDMTHKDSTRPTIRKNRVIAHNQQVSRTDWEKRHDISADIEDMVISQARALLKEVDVIILSDYGKGFLTERLCSFLIGAANDIGKPVIVDPKASFSKYKGATLITPNFKEFAEYEKIKVERSAASMFPYAKSAISKYSLSALIVTMGEDGMVVFEKDRYAKVHAIQDGNEIADVTGAGDTVIAIYALALAAGADYFNAMRIANYGAGVVVTKLGTATCSLQELKTAISHDDGFEEVTA